MATRDSVPPSAAGITTPDMYCDSAEARNNATLALSISRGGPPSFRGMGEGPGSQPPASAAAASS